MSLLRSGVVSELYLYDQVFERCFIGQAALIDGEIPMGWIFAIGRLILQTSAETGNIKDELEQHRLLNPHDSFDGVMQRVILRAFPSYTFEDLEDWSRPTLLKRFVIAEYLLAEKDHPYSPIELKDILSPEEKAKSQKRQQGSGIDFARENAGLEKATGQANGSDIWDLPPDEFAKRQKIAQHMSKRRR